MIWPYALGFVSARMYTDLPALSFGTCTWHECPKIMDWMLSYQWHAARQWHGLVKLLSDLSDLRNQELRYVLRFLG